jgi:hypothetical protein
MSYNQNGENMLNWFYPTSKPNNGNFAQTTYYLIDNVDICNNYVGIGSTSNISVSQLYNINYYLNETSIGNLFELNLPNFLSGTINDDYIIWPPSTGDGMLIQILKNTNLSFNYNINCSFVMVGGGGGGGNQNNSNAGGGGGAGQYISGNIQGYQANNTLQIVIGNGGAGGNVQGTAGGNTTITYQGNTITAYGGGGGGAGKDDSLNTNGCSGGSGSYSASQSVVGQSFNPTPSPTSIFTNMQSFANMGGQGQDQNNDTGAGGGGGGAGGAGQGRGGQNAGGNATVAYFGSYNYFELAGGGGGGGTGGGSPGTGGLGGSVTVDNVNFKVGGDGGGPQNGGNGYNGVINTGSGGGGANNNQGVGGLGSSGTLFLYILPSGVSL